MTVGKRLLTLGVPLLCWRHALETHCDTSTTGTLSRVDSTIHCWLFFALLLPRVHLKLPRLSQRLLWHILSAILHYSSNFVYLWKELVHRAFNVTKAGTKSKWAILSLHGIAKEDSCDTASYWFSDWLRFGLTDWWINVFLLNPTVHRINQLELLFNFKNNWGAQPKGIISAFLEWLQHLNKWSFS